MEGIESGGGAAVSKVYLPLLFVGFLCGVFLTLLFNFSAIGVIVVGFFLLFFSWSKNKTTALTVAVFGIGIIGGFFRTNFETSKANEEFPAEYNGLAVVFGDPAQKDNYQRIVIETIPEKQQTPQRFIAYVSKYPKLSSGQTVRISCSLEFPENRDDDFDYVSYLAKDNIFRICANPKLEIVDTKSSNALGMMIKINKSIENKINRLIPDPESSYLAGLLLGGSDRLPEKVGEAFRLTGTTHTVAVSGYNISIIAAAISSFLIFCGFWRKQAFWFAILGIVFFVVLIGSPASAVRAAIMGILVLWAAKNGRLASSGRALLLAATLMVFWSPLILVHDVGFQLSFLATCGIIYIYGPVSEKLKIENDFLELKSILLITISAQLGVLGILIYNFESISPISLLANVIILPAIPFIMLGGFVIILLSYVLPWLAHLLGIVVWLGLHLEIKVIGILAAISWSSIEVEDIGVVWLVGYYTFFFSLVFYLNKRSFDSVQKSANLDITNK